MIQTDDNAVTRSDENVTGNTSQDREFIRFENERLI